MERCDNMREVINSLGCLKNRYIDKDDEAFCYFTLQKFNNQCYNHQVATVNIKNATAPVVTKSND